MIFALFTSCDGEFLTSDHFPCILEWCFSFPLLSIVCVCVCEVGGVGMLKSVIIIPELEKNILI